MTLCLLLTGCAGADKTMQPALDLRAALLDAGGCTFTADVTADFGETTCSFTANCTYTPEKTRVEICSPDVLAGIAATITDDGASIEFDGVVLELGQLAGGNLAPLAAPHILAACWAGEYIRSAGHEADGTRVTYLRGYEEEELTVETLLLDDGVPSSADISYGGTAAVSAAITDFTYQK